jgi:hypothetical protein
MNTKASLGNFIMSLLRGIISMVMQDISTNKLQFASLLKFESHYPPLTRDCSNYQLLTGTKVLIPFLILREISIFCFSF